MLRPRLRCAFSLIEVVIAVGIFALAVTTALALLPALTRQSGDTTDALTAQRLPDRIRVELQRLATSGGFDALANRVPVMTAPLTGGLELAAAHDGAKLHSVGYLPPALSEQLPLAEQYFAVEVWRFAQPPLAYDSSAAVLALYVRVSWPYRTPASSAPTALADRQQLTCVVSLRR
ncbi:MAG: prepilin-type N-terminal cleavage/methylation domain-containing protein [Opitutae bacterium]|nr:prepilin-type N-terminal cleavage/methylation domain-containing protein [Opitutae bacterium]